MNENQAGLKWYKQGVGAVLMCIVIGNLLSSSDVFSTFNQMWIDRDVKNAGLWGEVVFVLLSTLLTGAGGPRQLVAFLGGYGFGVVLGTCLALLATVLGCVSSFYISRLFLRPLVMRRFQDRIARVDQFWRHNPIQKTLIIRLLPVGSNILTNMIAGASKISARAFFSGSAVGYLPQTVIFALLGKGIVIGSEWKIAVSVMLFFISGFLSFKLYQKHKNVPSAMTSTEATGMYQTKSTVNR